MNKYIRKIINTLFSYRKNIHHFVCDGTELNIIDTIYPIKKYNTRCIEDDIGGWYSAIYLSKRKTFQPILLNVQKIINLWSKIVYEPQSALILGCAGCSIVRYLSFRYPQCNITGIEYSNTLIEIAKNYFFIDQYSHFKLHHDDAFQYVKNENKQKYDIICVDLFSKNKICPQIFDKNFINELYRISKVNTLIIINMFGVKQGRIKAIEHIGYEKIIVSDKNNCLYLVLIRSNDNNLTNTYIYKLKKLFHIIT